MTDLNDLTNLFSSRGIDTMIRPPKTAPRCAEDENHKELDKLPGASKVYAAKDEGRCGMVASVF